MLTIFDSQLKAKQNGFTLIELMIVVVIVGILASFGIPSYRIWIENTKIHTAAQSIQAGLQKARVEALRNNAPVQFVVNADTSWFVGCVTVTAACPAILDSRINKEGSSPTIIVTAPAITPSTVVFTNLGLVAAAPVAFNQVEIDSSTLPAADSRELRVTLSAGGAIKLCDPYAGLSASDPRKC